MTCGKILNKSGFTLIEIIVTIGIVASLSGIMIVLISDSLSSSSDPVLKLRNASELSIVMANISDDYYKCPVWTKGATHAPNSLVKPRIANGHYYMCQSTSCTSDLLNEPADWSTPPIIDGSCIWQLAGNLPLQLSDLQTKINDTSNNKYGMYYNNGVQKYVIYYVVPPTPVIIQPAGLNKQFLKVTIADRYYGTGDRRSQMLTSYFISN